MYSPKNIVRLIFCVCLFSSTCAYAAIETLMQIPGIQGEYIGAGYKDWIALNSYSGTFEAGRCEGIEIEKKLDSASAQILSAATSRNVFPKVSIVFRESGLGNIVRQRITLLNVTVNRVSTSVSEGDASAAEALALGVGGIKLEVFSQGKDGTYSPAGVADVNCGKY